MATTVSRPRKRSFETGHSTTTSGASSSPAPTKSKAESRRHHSCAISALECPGGAFASANMLTPPSGFIHWTIHPAVPPSYRAVGDTVVSPFLDSLRFVGKRLQVMVEQRPRSVDDERAKLRGTEDRRFGAEGRQFPRVVGQLGGRTAEGQQGTFPLHPDMAAEVRVIPRQADASRG